jgi:hypothetical protein
MCKLLNNWDSKKHMFKVHRMHKLIGILARQGKGAPWTFKLMSHLYTSLAYALKNNKTKLENRSKELRELINQIEQKQFFGNQTDLQLNVNFVMKGAAKTVYNFRHKYLINCTMCEELNFISEALKPDLGIVFETPIAHLIPQIPTASTVGDSSLLSCGGYWTILKFSWQLWFSPEVIAITLFHLKDNSNKSLILINCLEYVTIILNYCTSLIVFVTQQINDDPHPIMLCVTDNTNALNRTLHRSRS